MVFSQLRQRLVNMASCSSPSTLLPVVLVLLVFAASLLPAESFSVQEYDNFEEEPQTGADIYLNMAKRYRAWGHRQRFPWKRLPSKLCYRKSCKSIKDCCRGYSICDRYARVCRDCWYGAYCKSEGDCCRNYPFCLTLWGKDSRGRRYRRGGKCVSKL